MEYVITVENDGLADAIAIDLTDNLREGLVFHSAELRGDLVGGTLTDPGVTGIECTFAPATCPVELTSGSIAGKATLTAPPVVGYLVIRATIQ